MQYNDVVPCSSGHAPSQENLNFVSYGNNSDKRWQPANSSVACYQVILAGLAVNNPETALNKNRHEKNVCVFLYQNTHYML